MFPELPRFPLPGAEIAGDEVLEIESVGPQLTEVFPTNSLTIPTENFNQVEGDGPEGATIHLFLQNLSMIMNSRMSFAAFGVALCALSTSVFAQESLVYKTGGNLIGDQPNIVTGISSEYGDQITLDAGYRALSYLSFDYYANYAGTGTFRIYDNTGSGGKPGALLSEANFSFDGSGVTKYFLSTLEYSAKNISLYLPDTFTWTVTFNGAGGGNAASLIAPNSGTDVGSSFDDFWVRTSGTPGASGDWALNNLGAIKANFGIRVVAGVPEPTTAMLSLVGLAGLLAFGRARR